MIYTKHRRQNALERMIPHKRDRCEWEPQGKMEYCDPVAEGVGRRGFRGGAGRNDSSLSLEIQGLHQLFRV